MCVDSEGTIVPSPLQHLSGRMAAKVWSEPGGTSGEEGAAPILPLTSCVGMPESAHSSIRFLLLYLPDSAALIPAAGSQFYTAQSIPCMGQWILEWFGMYLPAGALIQDAEQPLRGICESP